MSQPLNTRKPCSTSVILPIEVLEQLATALPECSQSERIRLAIVGYLLYRRAGFLVVTTEHYTLLDERRA